MKWWKNLKNQPWANAAIAACTAILFYVIITHLYLVASGFAKVYEWVRPVFLGLVIAYVLNPLANLFERTLLRKISHIARRRALATAMTLLVMVACIAVLMVLLIPQLVDSISTFVSNVGGYSLSLREMLQHLQSQTVAGPFDLSESIGRIEDILGSITSLVTDNMGSIGGVASSIGSSVWDGVLSVFVAVYFMADKYRMKELLKKLLHLIFNDARYEQLSGYWKRCNEIFVRFIAFDLLDGILVGIINSIFMLIAGIPYSVLISVVVGVTNLAPTFGPLAGAIIGGLILVLVNPWYALWFLIFTIVLQTIDGYILKPKLFGGSLGVPAIWILITLIVGGRMFGVVGILLAIPFAAIMLFICKELFPNFFAEGQPAYSDPDRKDNS
ncbi:MAG: AI-2E family transporter [Lachnospiraceae bacterium]|nr:AI-2E family transporter [Lachnospiraceae bacterium]